MQATVQPIEARTAEVAAAPQPAQEADAVLELTHLELSLVGGGVAMIVFD